MKREFNGVIYRTVNKVNNKWYIGKDENNNDRYLGSGKILKQAIDKYGRDNFVKETLAVATSRAELCLLEKIYIERYDACGSVDSYNIAEDGNGGNTLAGATSDILISFSKKLSRRWSEYSPEKQNEIATKISNANKGRVTSKETKKKISAANTKNAAERSKKISASLKDFWQNSPQSRQNKKILSEKCGRKKEENGFWGKSHSEETKRKISSSKLGVARNKKIHDEDIIEIHNLYAAGEAVKELSEQFGLSKVTIYRYLKNPVPKIK